MLEEQRQSENPLAKHYVLTTASNATLGETLSSWRRAIHLCRVETVEVTPLYNAGMSDDWCFGALPLMGRIRVGATKRKVIFTGLR